MTNSSRSPARAPRFRVRILGTGSALPSRTLTTAQLAARAMPNRAAGDVEKRTGISARRWVSVNDGESATSLAAVAVAQALEVASLAPRDLRRVLFVSSSGGDQLCPANVNELLRELGIAGTCDGFDINNACMGFLSAFDVAVRTVVTGTSPVAVVVSETLSRFIAAESPRSYVVLGDAAAAIVIGSVDAHENDDVTEGVLACDFGNDGTANGTVRLEHPGLTNQSETFEFAESSAALTETAVATLKATAHATLQQAGLAFDDIDWFCPHQPNGRILDVISSAFGVPASKVIPVVNELGSVGAAAIPVSLDRLMRSGRAKEGDRIMMVGVGGGLSWGSVIVCLGAPCGR
jgi:3-oxoacyl-(acyl-carrier-protein) synthase III